MSPKIATVGDRIEIVLTLPASAASAGEPRFPKWGKRWGGAEVVEAGPVQKVSLPEGNVYRQRIALTAFAVGPVSLPAVLITVSGGAGERTLGTPENLGFEIRSVLPPAGGKEGEPKAKPAVAPQPLPIGQAFWWTLGALSLTLALLLWFLRRRARRANPGESAKPSLAPFEELVEALAAFGPDTSGVEAHTRISYAVRRYLSRRLPFPALESTTSEIQRQLATRRLPKAIASRTVELLRACDLVKFARWAVDPSEIRSRQTAARTLAEELEGHFAPPASAPREAA